MEYTEKRWRCDHCQRDVRRGVMPPGWKEIRLDMYGNQAHYCADPLCIEAGRRFVKGNYPSAIEQFDE